MTILRLRPRRDAAAVARRLPGGRVLTDGRTVAGRGASAPRATVGDYTEGSPALAPLTVDSETAASWRTSLGSGALKAGHRTVNVPINAEAEVVTVTNAGGAIEVLAGDVAQADALYRLVHQILPHALQGTP